MKTRIIIFMTILTSLVSYSQKNETPLFNEGVIAITTDVNNFAVKEKFTYLNLDANYIGKLNVKSSLDIFVFQMKLGVAYSHYYTVSNELTFDISVPLHFGIGVGYSKSSFGFYSTVSLGTDIASEVLKLFEGNEKEEKNENEKENENTDYRIYSHLNVGATYFFRKKSDLGIIAEYSYALKGVNMISIGLAINMN